MAELQLIPNPTILAIQGGVFVTAMVVVKKLYVDPFLKLKDRRNAATTGNQDQASDLLAQNEADQAAIKKKIHAASTQSHELIAAAKKDAAEQRDKVIAAANEEAKAKISALSEEIAKKLEEERAKVPGVVAALSATVYERALQ